MKKLLSLTGGYPRMQDYVLNLQTEMLAMGNSLFGTVSFDLVLSGCTVTANGDGTVNIAAGIVYIDGQVLRFDGAANIAPDGSKSIVTGSAVTSMPLTFAPPDSPVKNVYSEVKGIIGDTAIDNNRQLVVGTSLLTFEAYIDLRIAGAAQKGVTREFSFTDPTDIAAFKAKFDDSGLGVTPDMLDWALMNGNNETADAQGRVFIGAGSIFDPVTEIEHDFESGDSDGEITHLLTKDESGKPAGLPPGLDGPRQKPGDGGGENIYYVNGLLGSGGNAAQSHNNMQPYLVVFKIRKIR